MCTKPIGRSFESSISTSLTEILFSKFCAGSFQVKMLHSLFLESSCKYFPYAEHLERADYKLIWTVSWVYCDNVILLTSSRHSRQCCVTHTSHHRLTIHILQLSLQMLHDGVKSCFQNCVKIQTWKCDDRQEQIRRWPAWISRVKSDN